MNRVETVNDADFEILLSAVRDEQTDPDVLRSALRQLGEIAGLRIARKWFSSKRELMTPMRQPYLGIVQEDVNVCVVSTRDDFEHFGFGVASRFPGCLRGYLDLHADLWPQLCSDVNCIDLWTSSEKILTRLYSVLHWFHKQLEVNVKNPRENRCFQIVIVFSFGSVDNSHKCTVLWKIAARLITVSTSVNKEMWVKLRPTREARDRCASQPDRISSTSTETR